MKWLLFFVFVVLVLAMLGVVTFHWGSGHTNININTQKLEQDTKEAVHAGKEAVHLGKEAVHEGKELFHGVDKSAKKADGSKTPSQPNGTSSKTDSGAAAPAQPAPQGAAK